MTYQKGVNLLGINEFSRLKHVADGSIERYKAGFVVIRITKIKGVDYKKTFSPIVWFASILLILEHMSSMDLELYQMDVKKCFPQWKN